MKLKELLNGFKYRLEMGSLDTDVSDIIYDSRKIKKGCIFVCLIGSKIDAHKFSEDAVKKGANVIVASREIKVDNCTVIKVNDTRYAMACMSAAYFSYPAKRLKTVGITGTKGKTTTTAMVKNILETAGIKTGTIGTLGVLYGDKVIKTNNTTPESYDVQKYLFDMVNDGCKAAILEASSLGLKWHRVGGFVFDYGVFTNFSSDHIGEDEHTSLEEYRICKSMLFKSCKTGIVNIDDPSYKEILGTHTCDVLTYSLSKNADYMAQNEHLLNEPGFIGAHFDLIKPIKLSVDIPVPGKFSAYNALAAIAVCLNFNVSENDILGGLRNFMVKGRVEPVKVAGNYTILIDYAHNALSMESILKTLREYNPNRLICLFGAGGNRPKIRRYEMGEVSGKFADLSIITEDNSRFEKVGDIIKDIKKGIAKTDGKNIVIENRKDAIKYCIDNAQDGDIIVLAGKGHEDYQEINGEKLPFDERIIIKEILEG